MTQSSEQVDEINIKNSSHIKISLGSWSFIVLRAAPEISYLTQKYNTASRFWHSVIILLGFVRKYFNLFTVLKNEGWLKDLNANSKVLDVGIGTGALSLQLLKFVNGTSSTNTITIHGVDISSGMLDKARKNFKYHSNSTNESQLFNANANCLPYPVEVFDMVITAHMLEYSHKPFDTIQEMVRVLQKGMPLLIVSTKQTRLSALHSLRWRYCPLAAIDIERWMYQAGIRNIKQYQLDRCSSIPGLISTAYIGIKI